MVNVEAAPALPKSASDAPYPSAVSMPEMLRFWRVFSHSVSDALDEGGASVDKFESVSGHVET